ncbi:hypothetical protein IE53DRAFT_339907 [Violaceomyces palustris]|uniref:Uncharacterized protein n=1 Tax=Violaceomyces palustris TaxID=1673888 RepID=A0ACD0P4B8_9BASI|nr:hypothetical protein IE53DRAFT_339907 [Violaceomyces palustris]
MTPGSKPQDKERGVKTTTPKSVQDLPDAALDLARRMFELARSGDATLLEYMKSGLPPNLTNNRGDTLLMLATYHGHYELVKAMLRLPNPPDTNQLNSKGQSVVAGAVFKGYKDLVRLLIENGADPTAGQPSAEETAKMFNTWEDGEDGGEGYAKVFRDAKGRGVGASQAPEPVPDREQVRRVPGTGPSL